LTAQTTLEELGLSSLDRVELMVALEEAFDTRIDETAFAGTHGVSELRALVQQPAAQHLCVRRGRQAQATP
jgi:acyl carrier protein